ncbi:MAG: DNA mismatch repair endonuclease MutL [Candidatus Eremiobacteraeota bacterium]|nr:DNA mismatch repair endonuclease MutL [Candidatus Eremiobacteraeota bacterium]
MAPIRRLDPVTVGQIAAGEVIERPQSIVKELVENAIDAAASHVDVSIERGGLELIEIRDDGRGIASSELALAVERHATSKLVAAEDLESIATLGFRGEGLASIAAIARVEVLSRTAETQIGYRILAHSERAGLVEPAAAAQGTCIQITRLFENVPVRREYLKSVAAEFNRISAWLSTFALAYPHVRFTLRHDGKDVWAMPSTGNERERLAMVFGKDAAAALVPLGTSAARMLDGDIRGWVSAPGNDRGDRRMQVLFVNGRLLQSSLLAGAWIAGYSTFTMSGRYPYGVLMLELPPRHVDPNVHPTKSDVRLRYGNQVFEAVHRAIAATLRAHAMERFSAATMTPFSIAPDGIDPSLHAMQSLFENASGGADDVPAARLRVLAQLQRTFILASDGDGILLVDQHAAHERIAYESIASAAQEQTPSEPLLVPVTIELDGTQSATLERVTDILREGGLDIEAFGERTFRIRATPAGYGARPFDLRGFIEDLSTEPKFRDVRERVWASLACHSVTVAGERLETQEMSALVDRLQVCANPMHCPHGRPTMVRLDARDIAKMFKRA